LWRDDDDHRFGHEKLHGAVMLTPLDGSRLEAYVHQPGVTILDWRNPRSAVSLVFDEVLERASRAHRDVRFATIDLSKERGVAREWQVNDAPTITAFRDGVLVFSYRGPLPEAALDNLIEAIWSLDMGEVKKSVDGQGSRVLIAFRAGEEPSFDAADGQPPGGNRGAAH
jgi:thioredoxin 1